MKPPGNAALAHAWLKHANSDLALAKVASRQNGILPEYACFHAQQAAEKALKAVMVARTIEFPLVHDLDTLLEILEHNGIVVPETISGSGSLTPYAVETRYPGNDIGIEPEKVSAALVIAEVAVQWAGKTVADQEK